MDAKNGFVHVRSGRNTKKKTGIKYEKHQGRRERRTSVTGNKSVYENGGGGPGATAFLLCRVIPGQKRANLCSPETGVRPVCICRLCAAGRRTWGSDLHTGNGRPRIHGNRRIPTGVRGRVRAQRGTAKRCRATLTSITTGCRVGFLFSFYPSTGTRNLRDFYHKRFRFGRRPYNDARPYPSAPPPSRSTTITPVSVRRGGLIE